MNFTFSFKNVTKFKRLIDTLNYQELIATIFDNIKLKPAFHYHSGLKCIVRFTLSIGKIRINSYENISKVINDIKIKKAITKDVHVYILQVVFIYIIYIYNLSAI
jgi:hypothetical protein